MTSFRVVIPAVRIWINFEEERFKAWGWASAGVMLFLAALGRNV